jgi:hypothetical protein
MLWHAVGLYGAGASVLLLPFCSPSLPTPCLFHKVQATHLRWGIDADQCHSSIAAEPRRCAGAAVHLSTHLHPPPPTAHQQRQQQLWRWPAWGANCAPQDTCAVIVLKCAMLDTWSHWHAALSLAKCTAKHLQFTISPKRKPVGCSSQGVLWDTPGAACVPPQPT